MNKELLNQIPVEEQPIAAKIESIVEDTQPSQAFLWELEAQLMEKTATQPAHSWFRKILVPVGWAIATIVGVVLLNWTLRSLVHPPSPATGSTATKEVSFAANVRAGNICRSPLAVAHEFAVFLANPEKTAFAIVDTGNTTGELRSFLWSSDGKQLGMVGNSEGSGNIYLTDPSGGQPQPILPHGELGYLLDAAWSHDGKQFVMWSSQNNKVLYLMNADGTGLVEKRLNAQILGAPQFSPDDSRIIFYGATSTSSGLFEMMLVNAEVALINPSVEYGGSYAFSPDGSHLAFIEYDRETGQANLLSLELTVQKLTVLGTLPIPKGSGSSVPETANLSWSRDSTSLVFEFGRSRADRAIYLAHADGTGLVKIVDEAYAPSISADGKCLAYISDNQVFLLNLTGISLRSTSQSPVPVADLPTGIGITSFEQDKLQWSPSTTP